MALNTCPHVSLSSTSTDRCSRIGSLGIGTAARLVLILLLGASYATSAVTAQYIRIDNPTGFAMEFRQIEVMSGGVNVLLHHPEMVSGTEPPIGPGPATRDSIVQTGGHCAKEVTGGDIDTSHRTSEWRAWTNPVNNANDLNPWIEVDLGRPLPIDAVVVYASRYPSHFYLDKGHRTIAVLDARRTVLWAAHWQYYDQATYPHGIFSFTPGSTSPIGPVVIPAKAHDWVPMHWLLDAEAMQPPPDATARMAAFSQRNSAEQVAALAHRFFPMLDERMPGLAKAFSLYSAGQFQQALDAWRDYWFATMARINMHTALHEDYVSYGSHGDDLMAGVMVTITPGEARAVLYQSGQIPWINLPAKEGKEMNAALDDCERKAQVGKVCWPLLYAYRARPDPGYVKRWAEIMDDWSMNFFVDAAKSPYEVENLFTFNPGHAWGTMMEDLSDIASERPELVRLIPSTTLARVQLLCLEKYSTAWWRQARETVFNHNTGGIYSWALIVPYIQEFHPGQRAALEQRQAFERFMTLGTERDGSMTEIGDEGHMEMPVVLGYVLSMLEHFKPDWYTPGWRNLAMGWYDNTFAYMFRHLSPGGYEHRFEVRYRPQRWMSTCASYMRGRPAFRPVDRDPVFFAIPEVRRLLDAFGHISAGGPSSPDPLLKPVIENERHAHDDLLGVLGNERPGLPHILSDWMPYTGAYYFRDGWQDEAPFLAMMACGSHGGSQAPQWPYGMFYHYDYRYPLIAAQPVHVDGLPPQQLFGRMNCYEPGTKTMALTNADETPAAQRWLSDAHFDFGEAIFQGGYQSFPGLKGSFADEHLVLGPSLANVRACRQIIQLHGRHIFIVTDSVEPADRAQHTYQVPYHLSLSTRKGASKAFSDDQLQVDQAGQRLFSDNPDGPSVVVHHVSSLPLAYAGGSRVKPDNKKYGQRLGADIAIADQPVSLSAKGTSWSLVSLISSHDHGEPDPVVACEDSAVASTIGFHATLHSGAEIWYQCSTPGAEPGVASAPGSAALVCGPAAATGEAMLVVKDAAGISGLLLGGTHLVLSGTTVATPSPDVEFATTAAGVTTVPFFTPIDPVRFLPESDTFVSTETVSMVSATPGIEIRYTTDGTQPTRSSSLYTAPLPITASTEFAARAFRLGRDGRALPGDDFEINGTLFTVPSYASYVKRPYHPARDIAPSAVKPGLDRDTVTAPWWTLYADLHWLAPGTPGIAEREMDLAQVPNADAPHGVRFRGLVHIPKDGVYVFHAPHEMVYMDAATSYDMRVYIDGQEWYLNQFWHGHGTWSVALKAGYHDFQLDFADARSAPWRRSGIWRYYPKPWAVYQGNPSDLRISGPDLPAGRIPKDWFGRLSP